MRSESEDATTAMGRTFARVDVRLAFLLAGLTAAFASLLLCGLLAYAVQEAFEEQVAAVDGLAAMVGDEVNRGVDVGAFHPGAAYRIYDSAGHERVAGGSWPVEDLIRREATLPSAFLARSGEYLIRERRGAAGDLAVVAWPLGHFVRERGELSARAMIVVLFGLLGSIALGIVSARRALRPLRDTTDAIRAIDPRRMAMRIPVRGAFDDVDRLAMATNDVLARLEWAFGRLSAFSSDVAHELRTPVNRMLNTAEVALTTTTNLSAKDDALASICTTAEAMRRTIEQLLLLARGEDGGLHLAQDMVELGAVIAGLYELYAPTAERLEKTLVVASAAVAVSADHELVERAVANLLENALVHTPRGATIRIGTDTQSGVAVVVVEDSGPGIPVADRARIFDRFVRLDDARGPGGAGLGLPIARMIARLHGGDLEVGASSLGGASFRLVLPEGR